MDAIRMLALVFMAPLATSAEACGQLRSCMDGLHAHQQASLWLEDRLIGALGDDFSQRVERRREQRERILSPTVESLPKNKWGGLRESGTRYALHRYFVHKHAMFVIGLEPSSETLAISPVKTILGGRVPFDLELDAEARLYGRGFGLKEISALAAAMEHFIHNLAVDRLRSAFKLLGLPMEGGVVTPDQMEDAIDVHNIFFFIGGDHDKITYQQVESRRAMMEKQTLSSWPSIQKVVRQEQDRLLESGDASGLTPFAFASRVAEEVGDKLGQLQNEGCHDLKHNILSLGNISHGRVPLANFYQSFFRGDWQFTESVEYLRTSGALEELPPPYQPRVIIPNYVNGPSNCLSQSGLYTMCCMNECNELMSHIESKVRVPEVAPRRLVEILQKLPSTTVTAPRELPTEIVVRLDQIGQAHHGKVPIHGRLFAQLMHHAFPLECPYPHFLNSSTPTHKVLQRDFAGSIDDMKTWLAIGMDDLQRNAGTEQEVAEDSMPWIHEEELLAGTHRRSSYLQDVAMFFVIVGVVGALLSSLGTLKQLVSRAQKLGTKRRYMI